MKVLVTGASGYLGGRLCHSVLRHGLSVRSFVRRTSDLSSLPTISDVVALELAYGDATDYPSLLAACSGCHVVFHAAALVEPWLPDPSRFISVSKRPRLRKLKYVSGPDVFSWPFGEGLNGPNQCAMECVVSRVAVGCCGDLCKHDVVSKFVMA
ncbi:hypothetical protein L1987_38232 [Smallanthus sonchifolius]|uniref:Uncharacterized protein n=1 Tax=Smallanthus sonchifolius TaxID=185202 RepID=A0ACB9HJC0_9ASTR|nr:hypothetical protein L1987_38232 [Smallanthus sonchifolius]